MFQSDYILRVIEQLGVLVRAMLDALREARPDEVLDLSEEILGVALGLDPDVALALTGDGLLSFMGAGGQIDPTQALMVGESLSARAHARALAGDSRQALAETERATVVLRVAMGSGEPELSERATKLLALLGEAN